MAPDLLFETPGWTTPFGVAGAGRGGGGKKRKGKKAVDGAGPTGKRVDEERQRGEGPKREGGPGKRVDKGKKRSSEDVVGPVRPQARDGKRQKTGGDLQTWLLSSLAGSRFRMLNEELYTTTGSEAHGLMSRDPDSFQAYHAGFRGQVGSWPVNPVNVIAAKIRDRADGVAVVADLGCGDAGLAKQVKGGKARVLSYDLRPDDQGWVVEADCSSRVPLPGGEEGQVVDVVVCCLSLMGTDWPAMLHEARRILRPGGTLHIAEVASRLPSPGATKAFTSFLAERLGFRLVAQDRELGTHFVVFELVKSPLPLEPDRAEVVKKGAGLLKPCIYKRR